MEKASKPRSASPWSVERIKETPRTTKLYTEAQWQAILARGRDVDRALKTNDVRLDRWAASRDTIVIAIADDMDAPWKA